MNHRKSKNDKIPKEGKSCLNNEINDLHTLPKHIEIANHLNLTTSALSYHLNKLVNQEIIEPPDISGNRGYNVKNIQKMKAFLRRYQFEVIIKRFSDTWEDIK